MAPSSAIPISMAFLICDVLNIVSVSFIEFVTSSVVNDLRCVPLLEQLIMTTVFLSYGSVLCWNFMHALQIVSAWSRVTLRICPYFAKEYWYPACSTSYVQLKQ